MYVEYPSKPNTPNGYQHLPVGSTGVKLTVPAGSRYAKARVAIQNIRYRVDGATAANNATGGTIAKVDDIIELTSPTELSQFTAIYSGTTGGLDVNYYKA